MKKTVLLIISLITGFEASAIIKECLQQRFTCFNPYIKELEIFISTNNSEQNSYKKESEERISSSQLNKFKKLELTVRRLEELKKHNSVKIDIRADGCQTADQTDKTFTCDYPNQNQTKYKLRCKSRDFICEAKSTQCFQKSNRKSRESTTIMPSEKYDSYSCKDKNKSREKNYPLGLVLRFSDFTKFTKSAHTGQNVAYFCKYDVHALNMFICKGEDPTKCEFAVNTTTAGKERRFLLENDIDKRNLSITIKKVTASDSGPYWCGAEMKDQSQIFIHWMFLDVVRTSTSPASTTTTSQPLIDGLSSVAKPLIIIGTVGLMLLLLVIVTLALYKGCFQSKKAEDKSVEHPKEDNIYEEIPDGQQMALTSIYVTASLPTNDPASLHYSTVSFRTGSGEHDAVESLIMKPSSSSCHYSAIKDSQRSTSLTSPPPTSTGEPIYSSVKKPQ